jgi:hypothetical protein
MSSPHPRICLFVFAILASVTTGLGQQAKASDQSSTPRGSEPLALNFSDSDQEPEGAQQAAGTKTETKTETTTVEPEPLLWKGFLYGDQHFKDKPRPVGAPLYFEDPFINTDVRAIFLWHKFPHESQLRGGQLTTYALSLRVALTDRLQLMATEDGYSHIESPILDDQSGWNDLAWGLKYALIDDHENDFLLSTGLRWMLSNGSARVLQGNADELSPFFSVYKGCGKWNFLADVVGRLPMEEKEGNYILSWDGHVDYELFKNFFPLFEVHGLHYLSNADQLPLDIGGLDYANIGSHYVAGHSAYWGGVGFRWNIVEHVSWGAVWEFPMQSTSNNDIFEQRVTTNVIFTF